MILEQCKGVHCVDLDESFPTSIYFQNSASIQPRTSPVKFSRIPRTDPPGDHGQDPPASRGLAVLLQGELLGTRDIRGGGGCIWLVGG